MYLCRVLCTHNVHTSLRPIKPFDTANNSCLRPTNKKINKKQPEQATFTFSVIVAANVESILDSNSHRINLKANNREMFCLYRKAYK